MLCALTAPHCAACCLGLCPFVFWFYRMASAPAAGLPVCPSLSSLGLRWLSRFVRWGFLVSCVFRACRCWLGVDDADWQHEETLQTTPTHMGQEITSNAARRLISTSRNLFGGQGIFTGLFEDTVASPGMA